ncbi:MAG TPA: sodium/proline symporter [bacterium]|nr:sodium/proline symporter [bacterium]
MTVEKAQTLIAMSCYMALVILIGVYYARRANSSSKNFFIGDRSIGPWVTAFSAEASDMSGWLLMGLPGLAYWFGLSDAFWTAIGLAVGTWLNWLLVARRLRTYSVLAGDAITIPDFLSNRFREQRRLLMTTAALFILIFFTVYAASCFVTVGKLFSAIFGLPYPGMMILGAVFVLSYVVIGGFLAETASDFMQAVVMIFALAVITVTGIHAAGGLAPVAEHIRTIPGFFEFFGMARPLLSGGVQETTATGAPLFGPAVPYGWLAVLSTLSWGLGYFGMPHVLTRFMAIRIPAELDKSRRIATSWCVISLGAAVLIGLTGRALYPAALQTRSAAEGIFVLMSGKLLPPLLAGLVMSGILAATISSSDSYLLIATSAFSKNIYQRILKKAASDREIMLVSRAVMLTITLIGILIALDENSIIFNVVSFAWAGFGATFGPAVLFSLFWRRTTRGGALAGMLSGGVMVFVWKLAVRPAGGLLDIYELLPAFLVSCAAVVAVSLLSPAAAPEIAAEFDRAKAQAAARDQL